MTLDPRRVQHVFLDVVDLPAGERTAALDRACADDSALRRRVEALLRAHDAVDDAWRDLDEGRAGDDPSAVDATMDSGSSAPVEGTVAFSVRYEPGRVIAERYTLQELIGEGGMGQVWVARQSEPVKRKVALKLIKAGMDSRAVLARFEQERQALAIMDHPNIARVLDGGMTAAGLPFFVMELVNGLPLTRFCDEAKLTPRERLELFVSICQAVQHAHQKGVVHRDLKPANILVTMVDGRPVPKIIDFGVAKAIGGKLTDESLSTQFGAIVGTLEYMSPEQAGFSALDVDTRSDVYSLGVILYELLTGLRPFDAARLREAGLTEMLRVIKEDDPSKPSTRCSTDQSFPSFAALRRTEPRKLAALLRGELDWIVMKCLEKKRDRRDETANALARDIQRVLDDEPVEARPPSTVYRMSKLLRRHKGPALATTLVALALVGGCIGTTLGMFEADRQRRSADAARDAEAARARAEEQAKREAQERLSQVRRSNQVLSSIFANLNPQLQPDEDRPLVVILADHLDTAIQELQGARLGDAESVARMQCELATALVGLGQAERALPLLERALETAKNETGPDSRETWSLLNALALACNACGRSERSIEILERLQAETRIKLGADDPYAIRILGDLGASYQSAGRLAEARRTLTETLERLRRVGGSNEDIVRCLNNLATTFGPEDARDKAIPVFDEAYVATLEAYGPKDSRTLTAMHNLAVEYADLGEIDRAETLLEQAFQTSSDVFGAEHPRTQRLLGSLLVVYRDTGKIESLLPLAERYAQTAETRMGSTAEATLAARNELAIAYWAAGEFDKAIRVLEELLPQAEIRLGRDHPETLRAILNLGINSLEIGDRARGRQLLEEAYDHVDADPVLVRAAPSLARFLRDEGESDRAVALLEDAVDHASEAFGADHPRVWEMVDALGSLYCDMERTDLSIPLFERLLDEQRACLGPDHLQTLRTTRQLAVNYVRAGRAAEAMPMFESLLRTLGADPDRDGKLDLAEVQAAAAAGYVQVQNLDEAIRLLEEAAPELEDRHGSDARVVLETYDRLGFVYWRKRKFDKSIPIFESLVERYTRVAGPEHRDTAMAIWNLATNYAGAAQLRPALEHFERFDRILTKTPELDVPVTRKNVDDALLRLYSELASYDKLASMLERRIEATVGADGEVTAESFDHERALAATYFQDGRLEESAAILERLVAFEETRSGPDSLEAAFLSAELGSCYKNGGRFADAIPLLERALAKADRAPMLGQLRMLLVDSYFMAERYDDYTAALREDLDAARARGPAQSKEIASLLAMLSLGLLRQERFEDAEPLLRECLEIRRTANPNDWTTFSTASMLGGSLLGQGKLEDAEGLLVEGAEGLQGRIASIPPTSLARVREALERLVLYYERTERTEDATRWRQELEQFRAEGKPKP